MLAILRSTGFRSLTPTALVVETSNLVEENLVEDLVQRGIDAACDIVRRAAKDRHAEAIVVRGLEHRC